MMRSKIHCASLLALMSISVVMMAQESPAPPASNASPAQTSSVSPASANKTSTKPAKLPTGSDRRQAAKLFMAAATLYQDRKFEQALDDYEQAAALDPTNADYKMAVEVARSHASTALIQAAARDREQGNIAAARVALVHAVELDPQNQTAVQHLRILDDEAGRAASGGDMLTRPPALGSPLQIAPSAELHSFHLRASQRNIIQQVFKSYGIDATLDDSVRSTSVRLDIDDVDFAGAARILEMLTDTFYVPLDTHKVVVARNTTSMRTQYLHNAVETLSLSGLSTNEMTEIGNIARNVFEVQQAAVDPSAATLTLRTTEKNIDAFNATYRDLMEGEPQVLLNVRILQIAHNSEVNRGIQPTQTVTAFNLYAEEQSLFQQNAALIQQIIASGLASPGDTLKILAILLASGQVSNPLFSNGFVVFGGGLTATGLSPGPVTMNLNLNSSDSRELDEFQLRMGDGEENTLKSGTRYPIETSSFSSVGAGNLNIPGLSLPGTSGSLGSLLSSLTSSVPNVPQVQYEDLGLVLKVRPRVMRSNNVALNIDMKITALVGQAINGVPVLANRSYTGQVMLGANQGFVVAADVDKSEMRAISGLPGISEIPGLNNVTDKDNTSNYASLLIIMTPEVVRSPHPAGHGPMLLVEHTQQNR